MEQYPQLGFGIMRLPTYNGQVNYEKAKEVLEEYMKGEFCYFDLHPAYMLNKAQDILREYIVKKYPREKYFVANKMPYYGFKCFGDYEEIFFQEMRACQLSYFDYYMLHAVTRDVYELHEKFGGFRFLKKIKNEGKAKRIGISFHDKPELLDEILIKYPELDFVQLQINFYDWNNSIICSKENYETARKHGKPIIVMEPIKGGSLANSIELNGGKILTSELVELSLQFVKQLPGIKVILSGMSEAEHVRENRKIIADKNREIDRKIYDDLRIRIDSMGQIPCTACKYCIRECPKNIAIPDIIKILNTYKVLSNGKTAFLGGSSSTYRGIVHKKGKASDCIKCGMCEHKCPQKLSIRKYMKEASSVFEVQNENFYTAERNAQILIYLMKIHGVKKIVLSPGATNITFSYSVQQDDFFEIYSAVDERSAAYMACGLAEESGEPVALNCTGATASRNYLPGLTEAFYRKLPILAITSSQPIGRIGHNVPQMIDRTTPLNDVAKASVVLKTIYCDEDEWECNVAANKALLELNHHGSGPVHVDLVTTFSDDFSVKNLPYTRVINRIEVKNNFPDMPMGRIGIFCGAHSKWTKELVELADKFCEKYNAVVLQDHTGNYHGKYGVLASLILTQETGSALNDFDLLIHIGNVSGAYLPLKARQVWRVNPDGKICDTFKKLRYVFEMEESDFFEGYVDKDPGRDYRESQTVEWNKEYEKVYSKLINLPFSNAWIAWMTAGKLPLGSVLHLGILNSLRNWNFFSTPDSVEVYSNTGGFGIDGCVSALIGASLSNPDKLYFGVVGDLAFFYDMNALGNRHIGSNLRLFVINNGCGTEFKNYFHFAAMFGDEADAYIAAKGHFGNKSLKLLRHYAEDSGFRYLCASTKEEYEEILPIIVEKSHTDKPLLIEIFTDNKDESEALKIINTLNGSKEQRDSAPVKAVVPKRFENMNQIDEVVLWGAGYCFSKNLAKVEQICKIKYVCDNNKELWGREIVPGIICISPEKLREMKHIFVVIMLENIQVAFKVMNQLLEMQIDNFDLVYNWLEYAHEMQFKDGDLE